MTTVQANREVRYNPTVVAGSKTRIGFFYNLNPDCSVGGAVDVRVVKQPSNGTINVEQGTGFTTYAKDNPRSACNARESTGVRVFYQAKDTFEGSDPAELESLSNGRILKVNLLVAVRPKAPQLTTAMVAAATDMNATRTVLAGTKTSVFFVYSLTPDCKASSPIVVRLNKEPSNGRIEIEPGAGYTGYPKENARHKCNLIESQGMRIYYEGNKEFKGDEQAELEAFYPNGNARKINLRITVK